MATKTESSASEKQTNVKITGGTSLKQICRACCLALPIFHPYGITRLCWDTFIMFALIYTAIEIPLTISFGLHLTLTNTLGIIAFSIDLLLLVDIAFNFRTPYYDKWDRLLLHTNPFDIAKKYMRGWFWLDLLTSLPLEFIVVSHGNDNRGFGTYIKVLRIFRLLRIFKILRVIRIMKIVDGLTDTFITREVYFVLRLLKLMGAMILSAHYFACIWWYVGLQHYDEGITDSSWIQSQGIQSDDSLFIKYSYSWYWAIVTLFTTGYGDITAHNSTEQWVCSVCILTGSCFFAYFVGTLTTWISEGDRVHVFEIERIEEARAFCRHHKFDRELTRTVLTHIRYYCNYNFVFESEELLPLLPPFLQREVNTKIAQKYLSEVDLFKDLPIEIIGQIALSMHSISCNAGKYLYKRGDVATCMYLQRTGDAKLRYLDGTPSRKLKRGDVVGERALISGKRSHDVLCAIWTEFFVLNIFSIRNIFVRHFKPKRAKFEWDKIRKMVKTSYKKKERKCNLAHLTPISRNRTDYELVHELSERASSLQTALLDKFGLTSNKNERGYTKIATNDSGNIAVCNARDEEKHDNMIPTLDMDYMFDDDINEGTPGNSNRQSADCITNKKRRKMMSEPNIRMNKFGAGSKSVPVTKLTKSTSSESASKSKSTLLSKISPFYVRYNSLRRNEKVISDTATTAFGKKNSMHCNNTVRIKDINNGYILDDDYSDTEELDLDISSDGSDHNILSPLGLNGGTSPGGHSGTTSKKIMGKFGGRKHNIQKGGRKRQISPISNDINNRIRKHDDFQDDIDDFENYGNEENKEEEIENIVQLSIIKEKVSKLGSYDTTSSNSSNSNDQHILETNIMINKQITDYEHNINNKENISNDNT